MLRVQDPPRKHFNSAMIVIELGSPWTFGDDGLPVRELCEAGWWDTGCGTMAGREDVGRFQEGSNLRDGIAAGNKSMDLSDLVAAVDSMHIV